MGSFSNNELYIYGFLSCANCIHSQGDSNCKREYKTCSFEPDNWNSYMQVVINNLKLANQPIINTSKLLRTNTTNNDTVTKDTFYIELVNDAIYLLNHKQIANCFSLTQLIDILKFVPNLEATYDKESNCFTLYIPKKTKN